MNLPVRTPAASIAQLGRVMQLAFVPADLEGAVKFWTETMGAGPFFAMEHIQLESVRYRGAPANIDWIACSASSSVVATTTPLPAARPSALMTMGAPVSST